VTWAAPAPLDLGEVFASPWVGEATIWRPWWLRWVPLQTRFEFRTEAVPTDNGVVVNDTQTFPNGRVWERTMLGERLAPDRWRMSADDMPGGAEIAVRSDGYSFTPYTIWAPVLGSVKVPLRCHDEVQFEDEACLLDTIEFSFLGVKVGTLTMRLRRT
jgi:hypothetical protein